MLGYTLSKKCTRFRIYIPDFIGFRNGSKAPTSVLLRFINVYLFTGLGIASGFQIPPDPRFCCIPQAHLWNIIPRSQMIRQWGLETMRALSQKPVLCISAVCIKGSPSNWLIFDWLIDWLIFLSLQDVEEKENLAATRVQAFYRGYRARKDFNEKNKKIVVGLCNLAFWMQLDL